MEGNGVSIKMPSSQAAEKYAATTLQGNCSAGSKYQRTALDSPIDLGTRFEQ